MTDGTATLPPLRGVAVAVMTPGSEMTCHGSGSACVFVGEVPNAGRDRTTHRLTRAQRRRLALHRNRPRSAQRQRKRPRTTTVKPTPQRTPPPAPSPTPAPPPEESPAPRELRPCRTCSEPRFTCGARPAGSGGWDGRREPEGEGWGRDGHRAWVTSTPQSAALPTACRPSIFDTKGI